MSYSTVVPVCLKYYENSLIFHELILSGLEEWCQ